MELWRDWRGPHARERRRPTADAARPPRVWFARTRYFSSRRIGPALLQRPMKASASIVPSPAPDHVGVSMTARVRYVGRRCGSFLSAVVFMCGADADGWI